jgi:hypothetical protein
MAEMDSALEHRLEDRLQLMLGTPDDSEDLARRRLLLDRLGQQTRRLSKTVFQPLRFTRTGHGASFRWAPVARSARAHVGEPYRLFDGSVRPDSSACWR